MRPPLTQIKNLSDAEEVVPQVASLLKTLIECPLNSAQSRTVSNLTASSWRGSLSAGTSKGGDASNLC